jgi:hypothetical protein
MTTKRRVAVLVGVALLSGAPAATPQNPLPFPPFPNMHIFSPFGDEPVDVLIGRRPSDQTLWVAYLGLIKRKCHNFLIGNDRDGLFRQYVVHGSSDGDNILIARGLNGGLHPCGGQLMAIRHYGPAWNFLDIDGHAGSDTLVGNHLDTRVFGGDGNDTLVTYSPIGELWGGRGSDRLYSLGDTNTEILDGGDDNDCLFDSNATARSFNCGEPGGDRFQGALPWNAAGCDIAVAQCPSGRGPIF